jgi:hypothetical protein
MFNESQLQTIRYALIENCIKIFMELHEVHRDMLEKEIDIWETYSVEKLIQEVDRLYEIAYDK